MTKEKMKNLKNEPNIPPRARPPAQLSLTHNKIQELRFHQAMH